MIKKVLESHPIDNYEAIKILREKLLSQASESNPLVLRTDETLSRILFDCSYETSREVLKELEEIGVSKELAIMLLNVLPRDEAEIRALLPPESQSMSLEDVKRIAEALSKCSS
ncbi:MAG: hypothetical protein QW039_04705 [Fervidicoccaceae archaeon]